MRKLEENEETSYLFIEVIVISLKDTALKNGD